jgi:hypothetical protein
MVQLEGIELERVVAALRSQVVALLEHSADR